MKAVTGGALGVLVLGLVAWGVVRQVGESRDDTVVMPISADAAYAINGPLSCDRELREVPHLPLEAEPVAFLLCADPDGSGPWVSPEDLVEGDLAPLVEVLADLEPTPDEPYDCTFQGGPAYDLLLRFSRDRYARIHGDTGGCGVVTVASDTYFGADEVLDAALALVEGQRERLPVPTAMPDAPGCPVDGDLGAAYSLTGKVTDLVVAVSCWRPDAKELPPFGARCPSRQASCERLLADVEQNSEPLEMPGEYDCPGGLKKLYSQMLVGRTAWGDLVALSGQCHEFYVDVWSQRPGDEPPKVWRPSSRSQRILDNLRR